MVTFRESYLSRTRSHSIIISDSDDSNASEVSMPGKTVKLPDFWDDYPDLWFAKAEEEFLVKGVTQETTKYSYLVGALPKAVANRVHDALVAKDDNAPYTTLKKRLIKAFTPTPYQRAEQLLDLPAEHAERPSSLMDRMLSLLPHDVDRNQPGFLFQALFLRKLPADIRVVLASELDRNMVELGQRADTHWASRPAISVAAIPPARSVDAIPPEPNDSDEANEMPTYATSRSKRFICSFHDRFGDAARKCEDGCMYFKHKKPKGNAKGRKY